MLADSYPRGPESIATLRLPKTQVMTTLPAQHSKQATFHPPNLDRKTVPNPHGNLTSNCTTTTSTTTSITIVLEQWAGDASQGGFRFGLANPRRSFQRRSRSKCDHLFYHFLCLFVCSILTPQQPHQTAVQLHTVPIIYFSLLHTQALIQPPIGG